MSTNVVLPRAVAAAASTAAALAAGKHTPVNAANGAITMTLPAAATGNAGASLSVEKTDSSLNLVTISGSIRGATSTVTLAWKNESVEFVADATGSWWPVAGHKTKAALDAAYTAAEFDQSRPPSGAATLKGYGAVLTIGTTGAFDAGYIESPCVFLDPVSGKLAMTYTAYTGPGAAGTASIGLAYSDNGYTWTKSGQMFTGTGVNGDPDAGGATGSNVVVDSFGVYHLFYIGLTATGYEAGTKTICHATATSLSGPWTRLGSVISPDPANPWRSTSVWHPNLVQRKGIWYLFFNATGTLNSYQAERTGYATATSLSGPWTVQDATSPITTPIVSTDKIVAGDPFVWREGEHWRMDFARADSTFTSIGDYWATTTDDQFPLGWVTRGQSTTFANGNGEGSKPWIYRRHGLVLHYSSNGGAIVLATAQDIADVPRTVTGLWRFSAPSTATDDVTAAVGDLIKPGLTANSKKLNVGNLTGDSFALVGQGSSNCLYMGWKYNATAANAYAQFGTYGTANRLEIQNSGGEVMLGGSAGKVGFYGTRGVTKPALTYSRAIENAAQTQLRTVLSALGLVTDSTTA
jgi:hypothetical protein